MPIDYTEQIKLIALKIRTLRKARKLTVQELAYRCDIERSNLSRIETGRSNPTVKTLCIICNALDVPLRALIEYTPPAAPSPLRRSVPPASSGRDESQTYLVLRGPEKPPIRRTI